MDAYLSRDTAAAQILELGRRMYERGFVAANDGNLSIRIGENAVLATPTGVSKGFMSEDMLVIMDLAGNRLAGAYQPTSELKMHLRVYQEDDSLRAVMHAHPPFSTAFAVAGIPLDAPILAEAVMLMGEVPIAPFALPGTQEVPMAVAPFVRSHRGILLANHGSLTWSQDPVQAFYYMESIEHYAKITYYARYGLGQARALTDAQIAELAKRREATTHGKV